MTRSYLVPVVGDGKTPLTAFSPKYFAAGEPFARPFGAMSYGKENLMLARVDTSDVEDAQLRALSDVVAFDEKSPIVPSQVSALKATGIPAGGFTGATQADLRAYCEKAFLLKQARMGLDTQAAAVAYHAAQFQAIAKSDPGVDAFLSAHAVTVAPLPVDKPIPTASDSADVVKG